ncbi:MAG TPA: hypothetical protein VF600_05100 [Abditibacteriaceae bacterium]|jgi:hypothetical protein
MNMSKKFWIMLAVSAAGVSGMLLIMGAGSAGVRKEAGTLNLAQKQSHNEAVVQSLTQGQSHSEGEAIQDAERPALMLKRRHFIAAWRARHERKVDDEIIPYLQDPKTALRVRAARALGRLESPQAENALLALLQRMKEEAATRNPSGVREQTVLLALARIRSRNLRGKARVDAVVQSVGLTLADLSLLSQKVNGVERAWTKGSPGDEIVDEVVDVLYAMGKRGENIEAMNRDLKLKLTEPQQVKLQGAALPENEEIQLILDYLSKPRVLTPDVYDLAYNHLANLGPVVLTRVMQRLQDLRRRDAARGAANELLIGILSNIGDRRVLNVLKEFEQDPNSELRQNARWAQEKIEANLPSALGP